MKPMAQFLLSKKNMTRRIILLKQQFILLIRMKMEPIIELVLLLKIRKGVNYDDRIRNLRVKANQDTRTKL